MTLSRYTAFAVIAGLTTFTADAHTLIAKSLDLAASTVRPAAALRVAESTAKQAPCCGGTITTNDD
jgi:hypothetical protein